MPLLQVADLQLSKYCSCRTQIALGVITCRAESGTREAEFRRAQTENAWLAFVSDASWNKLFRRPQACFSSVVAWNFVCYASHACISHLFHRSCCQTAVRHCVVHLADRVGLEIHGKWPAEPAMRERTFPCFPCRECFSF